MRVTLFADIIMYKDELGRPFPLRDQFIHFISPLSKRIGHLTIVSKCGRAYFHEEPEYLKIDEHLSFEELPFYYNTIDFYKRVQMILPKAVPAIKRAMQGSDLVILRIHNCLAWIISKIAARQDRPLVLYWAGPPIFESVKKNYVRHTLKQIFATKMALFEHRINLRIMRNAVLNFFIDDAEYRLMGSPENVEWIVPNLISSGDIVEFSQMRKTGPLKILFAGRLLKHKGIYDLLKAASLLRDKQVDFSLNIAGHGHEKDGIERYVKGRNLIGCVKILGHLSHEKLQAVLKDSNVLALPSYAEGLPKIIWEAWAAGIPVVTTDVGSIGNFVKHARNGLLIEPGNTELLARFLEILSMDEDLRRRLAESGISTAKKYTWENSIDKMAAALQQLVTGASSVSD